MSDKHHIIPVWFFVGFLFVIYGFLILVSGLVEWTHPPDTVLAELHAPAWWGALMLVLGLIFCVKYYPNHQA